MNNIPLPRLLDSTFKEVRRIRPINLSLSLAITPLSYASMELPIDESLPARSLVELYSPLGSAGIFRVRAPQNAYGGDNVSTTTELEHAVVEVGDYLVRADYEEMMPAGTAMQTIFSHYRGSLWQLGSVTAMGTKQIAVQEKHTRVLEAMLSLLDQCPDCMMSFDFSTTPWTINIVKRETTVSAEGRLSRNVSTAKITYDDTDLCTRVYYQVFSKDSQGQTVTEWRTLDADTISQYGVVERDVSIDNGYTASEAEQVASEFLRQRKNPRVSVDIEAEELSQITGEAWDTFTVGKLLRLALPDYNTTIEHNITNVSWDDVYNQPRRMTVSLADEEDTAITFLHDLDSKGGSKGGGRSSKKSKIATKEYYTTLTRTDEEFEVMAAHVDDNGSILEQAGLYLDADGILQYASDKPNMLAAHLQVNANAIEAEVSRAQNTENQMIGRISLNEQNIALTVQKGDVATQLALECGNVTIKNTGTGQKVNLVVDGMVTAESVNAAFADLQVAHIPILSVEQNDGFTYMTQTVKWCDFKLDGTLIEEFLGTGDINISIADTKKYKDGVSAAGALREAWAKISDGAAYPAKYTVTSGTNVTKSITVSATSDGWTGVEAGKSGSCLVYADAGGGHRAQYLVLGKIPYDQGYEDGLADGSGADVSFQNPTFDGTDSYYTDYRGLVEHISNGKTQTIPMRVTVVDWYNLSTTSPYTFTYVDTADPGNTNYTAKMRLRIDGSKPWSAGYAKGQEEAAPAISITRGTYTSINSGPSPSSAVRIWSGSGTLPTDVKSNGFYSFKVTAGGSTKHYYFLVNVS